MKRDSNLQRNQKRDNDNGLLPEFFRRTASEEGVRATLIGPNKGGTGEVLSGITAPTFSAFDCAPVLELAYRRGLHPRAILWLMGPNPIRGTTFSPDENRCDINAKCRRNQSRSAERINLAPKRKDLSLKAIP